MPQVDHALRADPVTRPRRVPRSWSRERADRFLIDPLVPDLVARTPRAPGHERLVGCPGNCGIRALPSAISHRRGTGRDPTRPRWWTVRAPIPGARVTRGSSGGRDATTEGLQVAVKEALTPGNTSREGRNRTNVFGRVERLRRPLRESRRDEWAKGARPRGLRVSGAGGDAATACTRSSVRTKSRPSARAANRKSRPELSATLKAEKIGSGIVPTSAATRRTRRGGRDVGPAPQLARRSRLVTSSWPCPRSPASRRRSRSGYGEASPAPPPG